MTKFQKHESNSTRVPGMVDLFAGAGGLSAGFERAGFELLGAVEYWKPAAETLKANHPNIPVENKNIRELDANKFLDKLERRPNIVIGGPSCQGFSTSGGFSTASGRDISDERNSLFIDFIRFVDCLQPEWVVMENVTGLLLFKKGFVASRVIEEFRKIGYFVVPMILLAADYGVPQLRRRLFFVGNKMGTDVPFPSPTHGNPKLWKNYSLPFEHLSRIGNKSSTDFCLPHVSFLEACGDLPLIEGDGGNDRLLKYLTNPSNSYQQSMREGSDETVRLHISSKPSNFEKAAFKVLKPGQNWSALPDNLKTGRFSRIRPYDATTLLKRLSNNLPAYTINTKFHDSTSGAYIHPSQNRTLSLREGARLQSFPDSYIFTGSSNEIRKQIGNAVPVLLAQQIALSIKELVMADCGLIDRSLIKKSLNLVNPRAKIKDLIGLKATSQKNHMSNDQLSLFQNIQEAS